MLYNATPAPDIEITPNDEDFDLRRDVQLWKAIDVLRGTDFTPDREPVAATTPAGTPTQAGG